LLHPPLSRLTGALLLALAGTTPGAWAQVAQGRLQAVTISDNTAAPTPDVAGWGDVPVKELPLSVTVIGAAQLQGARRLADVTGHDAAVTDAYNAPGYWDFVAVRGFVLDNRYNYQREGLPISAETTIPLDNKERIEILKGTSGIQAGTSAPGGLVNYVVKRPTAQDVRSVQVEVSGRGGVLAAVDLGGRFGTDKALGYRLNVAHEEIKPRTFNLDGSRDLVALAGDWRINRDAVLEAEFEWSHKSQPSQAGFSLLGSTLPAPVDPRLNLNNQTWSQPSQFDALTGTVRFEQALSSDWRWSVQAGRQELKSNDRLAYPFGCSAESNYASYCSTDNTYDMYDYRSENERRTQDALKVGLQGKVQWAGLTHELGLGLMGSNVKQRLQDYVNTFIGRGKVDGSAHLNQSTLAEEIYPNTNRDERATELSLRDAIRWNDKWTTWVGLRLTQLHRTSVHTDGQEATGYSQNLKTPWLALSYKLSPSETAYASYGEGVESQVVPNQPLVYNNRGATLPALKSRQWELGVKGAIPAWDWQVALFRIQRPVSNLGTCSTTPCDGALDGNAIHHGLDASLNWTQGAWRVGGSAMLLGAERQGSANAAVNGQRPTNVPKLVLRTEAAWKVAAVPGLELQGQINHEGERNVLADGSVTLPGWTRLDAGLRYATKLQGTPTTWTLAVTNLTEKRYWQESPTQFGHVYLYPGAARTLRLGVQAAF
jgi:iron complex outermembrane receptor protein